MTAMEQIEQLAVEARAHGMTYGEYIKRFNPQMPKPEKIPRRAWTNRIAQSKEYIRRAEIEVVCEVCGAKFTARSKNAKYCKDCKIERKRDNLREFRRREREEIWK